MTDRSKVIFGNPIAAKDVKKAAASKAKYARKFGDDAGADYPVRIVPNACLQDLLGVSDIRLEEGEYLELMGLRIVQSKAREFYYRRYSGFNTLVIRM